MTTSEYGTYTIAFAWAALISIPALLGADRLAARELAHLQINEKWTLLRGFLVWAFRNSFITLAVAALIFIAGSAVFVKDQALRNALWAASLLIPAFGLARLLQGSAEGLKALAAGMDGVILVAKPGQTRLRDLEQTVTQLRAVNARILGVVLNDVETQSRKYGYYYGSYYSAYSHYYDEKIGVPPAPPHARQPRSRSAHNCVLVTVQPPLQNRPYRF